MQHTDETLRALRAEMLKAQARGRLVGAVVATYGTDEAAFSTLMMDEGTKGSRDMLARIVGREALKMAPGTDDIHRLFASHQELKTAAHELVDAGHVVLVVVVRPHDDGVDYGWYAGMGLNEPNPTPSMDHIRCDLAREVLVDWSNAAHGAQLVWQEPATASS